MLHDISKNNYYSREGKELTGFYPYSQQSITKSISIPNWEKWEKVRLSSGDIATDSVAVPWANSLVSSNIPYHIRHDIKAENGWMLIKYTVNGNWGSNNNYMFFYNKYTGILKVFYYLSNGAIQSNKGMWHLHINIPQKLFAFSNLLADPINGLYQTQDIYCTNITSTEEKGFVQGWNCFQVELAYDPSFTHGELTVNPISRTESGIKLNGSFGSSSKGTIVSTTTTNPVDKITQGIAKATGDKALSFLQEEAKKNKFATKVLERAGDLIVGGVSSVVKGGINLLFHSFIARFNKEKTQNYDLQFTTNGTTELQGSIITEVTGGIVPTNLDLSKESLGIRLGVWNLNEQPIIYFDPTAKLLSWGSYQPTIYHLWHMKGNNLEGTRTQYQYIINPDIINDLKSNECNLKLYSVSPEPIEASAYPQGNLACKFPTITEGQGDIIYENYREITTYYSKLEVIVQRREPKDPNSIPRILFLPKNNVGISNNSLVKATATLCVNNSVNDTVVITKTFVPKLEWDPILYEQYRIFSDDPFEIQRVIY